MNLCWKKLSQFSTFCPNSHHLPWINPLSVFLSTAFGSNYSFQSIVPASIHYDEGPFINRSYVKSCKDMMDWILSDLPEWWRTRRPMSASFFPEAAVYFVFSIGSSHTMSSYYWFSLKNDQNSCLVKKKEVHMFRT